MSPLHLPVSADWSQFQKVADHTYKRSIAIFRGTFGAHYLDPNFLANANWAREAYDRGEIVGAIVYGVWLASATPAEQFAFFWAQFGNKVPDWLMAVERDYETWRGASYEQHGDHSKEINELYARDAHMMESWTAALGYGNSGDVAELAPHRDKRMLMIQAKYSPTLSLDMRGAIGQQYSDGQPKWGAPKGYPIASAPFGRCDHNAFLGVKSARELRAALRPDKPTHSKPPAHTPKHTRPPHPKPYPRPAARSAGVLVGARRESALFVRHGRLELEHHGKVVWTNEENPS